MADWRSDRKAQRKEDLEKKILIIRSKAEEREKLISAVEGEGVIVSPAEDGKVCCFGTPLDTKGLLVSTSDETFEVEVGCKANGFDNDRAVITFATISGSKPRITMDRDGEVELINIVFSGKDAIREALGVLRAATVLIKTQARRKE